jgi:hypothetical protein
MSIGLNVVSIAFLLERQPATEKQMPLDGGCDRILASGARGFSF